MTEQHELTPGQRLYKRLIDESKLSWYPTREQQRKCDEEGEQYRREIESRYGFRIDPVDNNSSQRAKELDKLAADLTMPTAWANRWAVEQGMTYREYPDFLDLV